MRKADFAFAIALIGLFVAAISAAADGESQPLIAGVQGGAPGQRGVIESLTTIAEIGADTVVMTGTRRFSLSGNDSQIVAFSARAGVIWAKGMASARVGRILASGDGGFFATITMDVANGSELARSIGAGQRSGVIRFEANGHVRWAHAFKAQSAIVFSGLASALDGGVYLSGPFTIESVPHYGNATRQGRGGTVLIRLDALGHVVWTKLVRAADSIRAPGVAPAPDGGLFVFGENHVLRVDRDGMILWAERLGIDGPDFRARDVAASGDGVIIGGAIFRPGRPAIDALAVSVDGAGQLRWAEAVDVGATDLIEGVAASAGGGVLLSGSTRRMGPTLEDRVYEMEGWFAEIDGTGHLSRSIAVGSGIPNGGYLGDFINATASAGNGDLLMVGALHHGVESLPYLLHLPASSNGESSGCTLVKSVPATVTPVAAALKPVAVQVSELALQEISFEPSISELSSSASAICDH
jgi:hypothetical protein